MFRQALIAACTLHLGQPQALAQSDRIFSANYVMPGCRLHMTDSDDQPFLQGLCSGLVRATFYFGRSHLGICNPSGVTVGQSIRVVVAYIDQRPARMHEPFEKQLLSLFNRLGPVSDDRCARSQPDLG
jgi:hypothetical protein